VFLRRAARLLAAISLLPVLVLGPLGPGIIVIHDHHEEDLHAHKVQLESRGPSTPSYGHDHPAGTAVGDGAQFVLAIPDLPRIGTQVQASGSQAKLALPPVLLASASSQDTSPPTVSLGAEQPLMGVLRAHDKVAGLLLAGHSLLI